MVWRSWTFVVVLILVNYIVFSVIATVVLPPAPVTAPVYSVKPTFTPGVFDLKRVEPLGLPVLTSPATGVPTATVPAPTVLSPAP